MKIAKDLAIGQSSVSREVSRNKRKRGYRHKQAHRLAIERSKKARARPKKLNFELSVQHEATAEALDAKFYFANPYSA